MNPTNPVTMHRTIGFERQHELAALEHRRHARAVPTPARSRPTVSLTARTHHRLAVAGATVALLLAMVASAVVAGGQGSPGPTPGPNAGSTTQGGSSPDRHGWRAE